ncbi:TPA: nucleoside deaminase [Klebsiella variicola subsp. variicola]|uniref:nucleoside deaminase n=1 Tax=Klebsiella variicola TaxID=244366 RepID=UPI0029287D0F|nr:nucleoside deaminase [Klebsiella variicola]HCI6059593.1 nucleoside deaminase [Klebsiella variicola subsp. variicola]ELN4237829.1 nucleoside deaminase [Klebsiella variicola]ELQ4150632.1 nucleoside deaminase [Klebsiella variicola]EMC8478745.1 nucleoside deaminase [Klebsiella variicola]HCI6756180.1 nucleoside deaminase [Klebsiella variicola subsp. variicola]
MSADDRYLQRALALAKQNIADGGRPFGAVLVRHDEIVAEAVNTFHLNGDPTAHAELNAVRELAARLGSEVLRECVIYASGQPCPMCLSALYLTDVREVFFANSNQDGEPFQLSTTAIYQQLQQPLSRQTLPIHHCPQPEGPALYQRWAEQQP